MKRGLGISRNSLVSALVFVAMAGPLVGITLIMIPQVEGVADLPLVIFFGSLAIIFVVGQWRTRTDRETEHPRTAEDVAYNPLSPGQMAKDNWRRAIRRIPGDSENDEE